MFPSKPCFLLSGLQEMEKLPLVRGVCVGTWGGAGGGTLRSGYRCWGAPPSLPPAFYRPAWSLAGGLSLGSGAAASNCRVRALGLGRAPLGALMKNLAWAFARPLIIADTLAISLPWPLTSLSLTEPNTHSGIHSLHTDPSRAPGPDRFAMRVAPSPCP